MPNTAHNVMTDIGCQKEADDYAAQLMRNSWRAPKTLDKLNDALRKVIAFAYLRGKQDGINAGYLLCEQDMKK